MFLWLLLAALLTLSVLVWSLQIPFSVSGSGIVLHRTSNVYSGASKSSRNGEEVAVVFLPADQAGKLQPGLPTLLRSGTTGLQVDTVLSVVEPGIVSPYTICKNDGLLQYLKDGEKLMPPPTTFDRGNATQTMPRISSGFALGTACAALPDQPSRVALISLSKSASMTLHAGSVVQADVTLGRQCMLQLLLRQDSMIGA